MHKLETLKDMLCKELEEYGERDNLDIGGLEVVDKLAHAIKNIDKIIEADEEQYSGRGRSYGYDGRSYGYDRSYDGRMYDGGRSYDDRSMRGRGRNAKRDSMGRYSSAEDDLRRLMENAPDEQTRKELERMMQRFD